MRMPGNYDKFPEVRVRDGAGHAWQGWPAVAERVACQAKATTAERVVVVVECYPGVDGEEVTAGLVGALRPALVIDACRALKPAASIDAMVARDVTDDPVFGRITSFELEDFLDVAAVEGMRATITQQCGVVLVVGAGACLIHPGDVLVYADLARWEAQLRFRRGEVGNLGADNRGERASLLYKRAFFVDWRVADRLKRRVFGRADFVLDTNEKNAPRLVEGEVLRAALQQTARQPFRVVPFFDPAPWGGQWMKQACDLYRSAANYGWCFDCVPEENSLYLRFGDVRVEVPSIDVVFFEPRALLGDGVHGRFGAEFPIRTDFLDTMGGGNLSLQVHPTTDYIQQQFGMNYTQDESYYMLDAGDDACVYLGVRDGCDVDAMVAALRRAESGGPAFDADAFANRIPARRHDHFLIPAGTVHCSGADAMVLEISATPYIFTFKLWDWGQLGLDGRPRPTHIDHGARCIDGSRDACFAQRELVNAVRPLSSGAGWREERTGLHAREFLETRRFWFSGPTPHDTRGNLNVLNLIEGEAAVIESPTGAFEPFELHYAETVIVPAAVGPYVVRPLAAAPDRELGLLKVYVRTGLPGGEGSMA